jgi:hypothetical protein
MSTGEPTTNLDKLKKAGYQFSEPLPPEYLALVNNDLQPGEVEMLINLMTKVKTAEGKAKKRDPNTKPHYEYFIHPPF